MNHTPTTQNAWIPAPDTTEPLPLKQVKGNTWVAEGVELVPFYKLDEERCILLDSGLVSERDRLEAALLAAGLSEDELDKIWWANAERVLRAVLV